VLSGQLNDGTAGLYEIKRQGGIAIVQTPSSAQAPSMPSSALENIAIDYCLPVAEMPRLLKRLVLETGKTKRPFRRGLAVMENAGKTEQPTALTCPECGGATREQGMGSISQFRCHIGHVMTAEIFASAQIDVLENTLCEVRRILNERATLCRTIAEKHFAKGNTHAGEYWKRAAEEAAGRVKLVEPLIDAEWTHPETA
jgi:two-component system chemotaxis response regulator CheB